MGGIAPANQPRLSFTGSEDGEAETETCRAAQPLWRTTTRTLRPVRAQLTEPPYADPHVRWFGRGEPVTAPPIPIFLPWHSPSCLYASPSQLPPPRPCHFHLFRAFPPSCQPTTSPVRLP